MKINTEQHKQEENINNQSKGENKDVSQNFTPPITSSDVTTTLLSYWLSYTINTELQAVLCYTSESTHLRSLTTHLRSSKNLFGT